MSTGVIVLCAVLGAVAGAVAVVPALRKIPEVWDPTPRAQVAIIITNAVLWALAANNFSRGWVLLPYLVVFSVLLAVSVVDLRLFRIPDRFVFPGLAITIVLIVIASFVVLPSAGDAFTVLERAVVGLLTYFGILFFFHLVYPRGMGFGDVKLALLMGLSLGWLGTSNFTAMYLVLIALFFGCVLGIVFGVAWRIIQRQGGAFPFGPALAAAVILVVLTTDHWIV
jgi:prepilin signal peptidase PulO-like enzyme (type II secretory pathway)